MNLHNYIFDFNFFSASIVALALFNLFFDPERIFEEMFFIPAKSQIVLTAPPATKPLPFFCGFVYSDFPGCLGEY